MLHALTPPPPPPTHPAPRACPLAPAGQTTRLCAGCSMATQLPCAPVRTPSEATRVRGRRGGVRKANGTRLRIHDCRRDCASAQRTEQGAHILPRAVARAPRTRMTTILTQLISSGITDAHYETRLTPAFTRRFRSQFQPASSRRHPRHRPCSATYTLGSARSLSLARSQCTSRSLSCRRLALWAGLI